MTIDITDFLPKYPLIEKNSPILDSYSGETFNNSILRKTEFYENKLSKYEKVPTKSGELMKNQISLARFLSSRTIYDSMLIMHAMGVGKTCGAIAVIEQIRQEGGNFKGAMIFARGDGLLNNFINELVFKCTNGQYIPENFDDLTELEKIHRINKKIRQYYEFHTFETFAKKLKEMKDFDIEKLYSNRIIVIDEVHNIRPSKKEGIETYKQFFRLCHIPKNIKVLLLSGTPMKDGPEELSSVLNLLLPNDKLLPMDEKFKTEFFNTDENEVMTLKPEKIPLLKNVIKGRVSYLSEIRGDVKKEFMGRKIGNLNHFKVYPIKMSDFQTKHYSLAFEKDHVEKGIYSNSRQASLFVFPDGSYGPEGFDKYIIKRENRKLSSKEGKSIYTYTFSSLFLKEFSANSMEDKFDTLEKFSAKYAFTIRSLFNAKKNGKLSFIYSEFVQGSGIILFIKLLELFGFSRAYGYEKTKGLRYAVITNQTTTVREIKNVMKRFNNADNMNGDYISVIIGSEVISEGYSLKNVLEEHVFTPYWNYSETSQAIARGFRAGSHRDLIEAGITPVIQIYLSVSIPDMKKSPSIDLKMYEISEIKDINIKHVERLIKKVAYDCALSYERNHVTGADGERECDYMNCDYKCEEIDNKNFRLDNSTYQLYYSEKEIDEITTKIINLFRTNFALNFEEITNLLKKENHTTFNILSALERIIFHNLRIYNRYGFVSYLREDNDIYFLSDSVASKNSIFSEYYTQFPNVKATGKIFSEILSDMESKNYVLVIEKIFEIENEGELLYLINRLSDESKEMLLEGCILAHSLKKEKNAEIRSRILSLFKNNYRVIDNVHVSFLLYNRQGIIRCLENDEWRDCSDEYSERVKDIEKEVEEKLNTNVYGYYGLYNPKEKKFCIRDVSDAEALNIEDKRRKKVGAVCETWNRQDLIRLASVNLKIDIPIDVKENKMSDNAVKREIMSSRYADEVVKQCRGEKFNKDDLRRILYWSRIQRKDMCEEIQKWFHKKNLLIEDLDCGVQTKKR